jgi:hypothetical protein
MRFDRITPSAIALSIVVTPALAQPKPIIGPPVRVDPGGTTYAANETTASASGVNPKHIVAGWNDWRRSPVGGEIINSGFSLSINGGQSWTDFLLRPPVPNQSSVEGDPMTGYDQRTGTLWAGAISFSGNGGIYVARKLAEDTFFQDSVMARVSGGTDKGWIAAGPRPGMPDTTRVYITYNEGVIRSDDLGVTWTSPVSLGFGIGYLPRVGPGGELYVAFWDFGSGVLLKRSLNGGQSFTDHVIATRMDVWGTQDGSRFPGTFRVPSLNYIAVDPNDGTLYATYFDTTSMQGGNANVDVYFTKSTDQGTTWTTPVVLNGDAAPAGDQFFSWIEADQHGRLHVLYWDSRRTIQNDNAVNGMFDAYYAYSVNGGDSWMEFRLTPATWNSDDDGLNRPQQFMGDYLGMAVAGNFAYPVYVDTSAGDPDTFVHTIRLPIPGDVDFDGTVAFGDLLILLSTWGPCTDPSGFCDADLNGDGVIDFIDLLIVLANWT